MSTAARTQEKPSKLVGALSALERVGNLLPHPFWLFVILGGIVLALSSALSRLGLSSVSPTDGETVEVVDLLNQEGIHQIISEAVPNFTSFPPLGLIIIVMLGVAVAEYTGLISATIRLVVSRVSPRWLTFVLALTGVTGSVASDAIYVVLIPLGAAAFKAVGRSPVLGAVVAFGSASAGYNASLLITGTDAILAGLSTSAAQIIDETYVVTPVANYFFAAASAVWLAALVTLVTELLLTKTTRTMVDDEAVDDEAVDDEAVDGDADDRKAASAGEQGVVGDGDDAADPFEVSAAERRGLRWAALTAVLCFAAYFALLFWPGSILRGETGALDSPLLTDVVVPIALVFGLTGAVYGVTTGAITSFDDVPKMMGKGIVTLAPVLVLFFAAAQFLAYFRWSNLGQIISIEGAGLLEGAGLPPLVLFAGLVLLTASINFFITSGSAQYALMAPVIVPMFMLLGYSPEVTQMLYRMGDSPTNIISPMSPYFALALGYVQQYYSKAGIGTLISLTLPISMTLLVGWFAFFALWYTIGLPLGPGVPVR
ncbi:aminobenzoyl-glutamate transport protein [Kineosphaera limosa]|uniref:Aminobenzoyl-glutamate transport protein n=1 Tax=Kineosphaera limosa NBRC 100340 TaxID=1184609 RepID=K6W4U7_9MICO|nr:AbgT family transporter [Kineosphaera limosa]NYE02330.1 aminobenzoyl-glutamate transport protein [Kineosphaera limosa]GAB94185.1 aminobenzoyl-glutamate transport protein [Kineosphaera limosa NBRC 100340]